MKVLVVDDNETSRKLLRVMLQVEGFHVFEAGDGVEALEALEAQMADAIICDILMPRMDGYRFCFELRRSEKFHHIPILIYTNTYTSASDEKMALDFGANQFIRKPASVGTLVQALRQVDVGPVHPLRKHAQAPTELSLMHEYNERLVSKLEEKNLELLRANDELRATRDQLCHLLQNSPAVLYTLRVKGQAVAPMLVSENVNRMLGFTAEELLKSSWWTQQVHPADMSLALNVDLGSGEADVAEADYRIRAKDGSIRWVHDIRRRVPAEGQETNLISGVWQDITARKAAEHSVRDLQERFQQLAENIDEVFWMTDVETNQMLYVSPGYERVWGRSVKALYASPKDWVEAIHPEDRPRVLAAALTKQRRGDYREEYRIVRPEGTVRWIRDQAFPIRNDQGKIYRVAGVAEDITERKAAESRLAAQYGAARAMAESPTLPETLKRLLQGLCEDLGWDVGALWMAEGTTTPFRCLEVWHRPEAGFEDFAELTRHTNLPRGAGLVGRVGETGNTDLIRKVIEQKEAPRSLAAVQAGLKSAVAFPVRRGREVIGVLEFLAREEIERQGELVEMFDVLGKQLVLVFDRAQLEHQFRQAQKMEAVGQLAGGVAHDFNNLLTVIQGHAELARSEPNLTEPLNESLDQISQAAERAANLTRQLLLFSRKQILQTRQLDLNAVVSDMSRMLGRMIGEQVSLECDLSTEPLPVCADPGMLDQVLLNLAINARDAMAGGGKLRLETGWRQIEAADRQTDLEAAPGGYACLRVTDSGCGIPEENLQKIFEPFFTTKPPGKGTGLGLATVYGIVKQHGGWINVISEVGDGQDFACRTTGP